MARGCVCLAIFALAISGAADQDISEEDFAQVAKFPVDHGGLTLEGEPSPMRYFDVVGRGAFLMGTEAGKWEAWITPFKIAHEIGLSFRRDDFAEPLDAGEIARWITVGPAGTSIVYAGDDFTCTAHLFVPAQSRAIVILLDLRMRRPMIVAISFQPDLQTMWPASLGGQYARWDEERRLFLLSESRRRYNAVIGSPLASRAFRAPAHRLGDAPYRFEIDLDPVSTESFFVPIVITGGMMERDAAMELYGDVLRSAEDLWRDRADHARHVLDDFLTIDSPDDELDRAVQWSKVALDDGMSTNPELGTGLIAGYGLSGGSARPGFAWYFGGDLFFNQFALTGYGDFDDVRTALELIRANQRDDGKIMHELSQGAPLIDWFGEYPYGYYHLETSPYYIVAVMNYVRAGGDVAFLRESWPSMLKAYRYALTTDTDGDGLPENSAGGLGALEVGVLLKDLKTDIYVAGLWTESLIALREAAEILGDEGVAREASEHLKTARHSLESLFFDPESGFHALALAADGSAVSELTAWPAVPMLFNLLPEEDAAQTLKRLASPEIAADYGLRMLTDRSEAYDPTAYNNGAVWPFLSGYVAVAQYNYRRPLAGWQIIDGLADLVFDDSRGDIAELYSGDHYAPLSAAVPHQLFSSGGLLFPLIRGALGLEPDAVRKRLAFSPRWPVEWDDLRIEHVRLGAGDAAITFEREGPVFRYRIEGDTAGWKMVFRPLYPVGSKTEGVTVDGVKVAHEVRSWRSAEEIDCTVDLNDDTVVEVRLTRMAAVIPPPITPIPGSPSAGARCIDSYSEDGEAIYEFAGRSGAEYQFTVLTLDGSRRTSVVFPESDELFSRRRIAIAADGEVTVR